MPQFFRKLSFNAANLAEAVNYFVESGEESAARELSALAPERVGWVCRILFQPKGNQPLRPPSYGALDLPHFSMPLARWPLYPVAASGKSFFVLSKGYRLAGVPEDPLKYLAYCRAEGAFRKETVPVPTRAEAEEDVLALRQSPAWKAILWEDSAAGTSYTMRSEEEIWRFIQAQADAIK